MKYLLDTNICITLIRRRSPQLLGRVQSCAIGELGISTITVAELMTGVSKSGAAEQNGQALEQFLLPFVIADFDYDAATVYGEVRAHLERVGTPIGSLDTLIGAHARSLDVTLVTNNTRELCRIPGLIVEDWTVATAQP